MIKHRTQKISLRNFKLLMKITMIKKYKFMLKIHYK